MNVKKRFIILTLGRSGSTLVQSIFNSSPNCTCAGESYGGNFINNLYNLYNLYDKFNDKLTYNVRHFGYQYNKEHQHYSPKELLSEEFKKNIDKMKKTHLQDIIINTFPYNDVSGFKILLHDLKNHNNNFEKILLDLINAYEGLYIILLIRNKNKIL